MIIDRKTLNNRNLTIVIATLPLAMLIFSEIWHVLGSASYIDLFSEDGPAEYAQFVFYLISTALSVVICRSMRSLDHHLIAKLYLFFAMCTVILAMEEISWGQRILGFETPEYFTINNMQREVSFHNLDSIGFDGIYSFWINSLIVIIVLYISLAWTVLPRRLFAYSSLAHYVVPSWYLGGYFLLPTFWMAFAGWPVVPSATLPHEHEFAELLYALGCLFFMALGALRISLVESETASSQTSSSSCLNGEAEAR